MAHEISWIVPKRVIYQRFYDVMVVGDLREIRGKFEALLQQGEPPVHLLVSMIEVADFPRNIGEIRKALGGSRPYDGWVVIATHNTLLRFMSNVVTQVMVNTGRFRMFASLEAAIAFLREVDPTVPEFQPPELPIVSK